MFFLFQGMHASTRSFYWQWARFKLLGSLLSDLLQVLVASGSGVIRFNICARCHLVTSSSSGELKSLCTVLVDLEGRLLQVVPTSANRGAIFL